uniref:Extracellular calcium-sensing receptor-like n=1 Tax=Callorhinchus milii TaxID=7868 RepID=A0A4W3GXZ4_CALMI
MNLSNNSIHIELTCLLGRFDLRAFRWIQTMIFTIEEINREAALLPNLTLGYKVYDTCDIYALRAVMAFVSDGEETVSYSSCDGASVPAMIGEAGSLQSTIMASTTAPFQIPILSYFSTCTCLSNKKNYPNFLRMVPSDSFQTQALAQLVRHFGWTWIRALGNNDDYGRSGVQLFSQKVMELGACMAFSHILPKIYSAEILAGIVKVIKESGVRVIVVFASEKKMLELVQEVTGIQWLASEAWVTGAALFNSHLAPYLAGTIGFSFRRAEIPQLREFLLRARPSPQDRDNFLTVFWEELNSCKFNMSVDVSSQRQPHLCTGSEDLEEIETIYFDTSQLRVSYNVYKAVYAIAHALRQLQLCQSGRGPFGSNECADVHSFEPWQLLHYLKGVKFTDHFGGEVAFDENGDAIAVYDIINCQIGAGGDVTFVEVGHFEASAPPGEEYVSNSCSWSQPPRSVCSESCPSGMRKASRDGEPLCCFDCVSIICFPDSVECTKCSTDDRSNPERNAYIPKEVEYLSFQEATGIALVAIALFGACLTVTVSVIFFHYKTTPVVKANNSELSFLLLTSLVLCFLCSIAFIGQPTDWGCKLRYTAFAVIFELCICCVLAKTVVVLMAFRATLPNSNVMQWFSPAQQRAAVFIAMCVQVLICVAWLMVSPPFPFKNTTHQNAKIILQCHVGSMVAFCTVLGYIGFLSCICFVLAFLARKLPDTFNEAKFITFSMLIFFAVWIVFIPVYLSSPGKYTVAVQVFAILSSSFALLLCIFAPKCYIILLQPERNTRQGLMGKH